MKQAALSRIITVTQIQQAREELGWTIAELSRVTGLSLTALYRAQDPKRYHASRPMTLSKIRVAFESAGIKISDPTGSGK